jgi:opacity protein-like surface antigen
MKKLNITLMTIFTTGTLLYAGGTFVEPVYETEDVTIAEEAVVEEYPEVVEEYVEPSVAEEYVEPAIETKAIENTTIVEDTPPPPPPLKDIKTNGLYAGIGISSAKFKTNCKTKGTTTGVCLKSGTDKTAGLMGRVGYDVNQYIGIEARGIRTNWKADGGKVKHVGIFVKPMIPVGDSTNLYALAGVAKTTTQGRLQRVDSKSFAWGAGVEYDISKDRAKEGRYSRKFDGHGDQEKGIGVFADYERLIQKSGSPDLDTVNVGLTYDF